MKKSRFNEEQIIGILKKHEAGQKVGDLARGHVLISLLAVLALAPLFAQSSSGTSAFEVASIKPSDPLKGFVGVYVYPGGRVQLGHQTLETLIAAALKVETYQIKGGPDWARSREASYDIEATAPAGSASSQFRPVSRISPMSSDEREMVLVLLRDRFRLKFHIEEAEGPVLILSRSGKPLKLDPPADAMVAPWMGSPSDNGMMTGTGIRGVNVSMSFLADGLKWYFERPVLDETGLIESFDFRYLIPLDGAVPTSLRDLRSPESLAAIVSSLDKLGLRLKAGKGPVKTVVIDQAEKPTAN